MNIDFNQHTADDGDATMDHTSNRQDNITAAAIVTGNNNDMFEFNEDIYNNIIKIYKSKISNSITPIVVMILFAI